MDINLLKEISNIGGQLAVVILFLLYLTKKDELNKKSYDQFNQTISNHLHTSNKVIQENSKALKKVAVNLKELSIAIKNGKKSGYKFNR